MTLDLLKTALGNTNPYLTPRTWSKTQPVGVSLADHYDGFVAKVNECANAINEATRKVAGNFMICGLDVKTVLQSVRTFSVKGQATNGSYYLGDLGNMKVYVNPMFPRNHFVIGYKGSNLLDAGAFYCPYRQELSEVA